MNIDLDIHEIIHQLIKVYLSEDKMYRDENIRNLTPIDRVSEGPTAKNEPAFTFLVGKVTPKDCQFSFDDLMTPITSKVLYAYYTKMPGEEFIMKFNKTIYEFVSEQLKVDMQRNVPYENNIWVQPNSAFVNWFHEKGVNIDSAESFIQIEPLLSKFKWKDCEIIIYKDYQISFISPNISDSTPKHPSSVGLYFRGNYSSVFETIMWFAQHGNPFNPALVIDGNPNEFSMEMISSRIRRLNIYLKEHFGLNDNPILRYSRAKVGYFSKLNIRLASKLNDHSESYFDSEDALSKANFDDFQEDPIQAHLRNKSR